MGILLYTYKVVLNLPTCMSVSFRYICTGLQHYLSVEGVELGQHPTDTSGGAE